MLFVITIRCVLYLIVMFRAGSARSGFSSFETNEIIFFSIFQLLKISKIIHIFFFFIFHNYLNEYSNKLRKLTIANRLTIDYSLQLLEIYKQNFSHFLFIFFSSYPQILGQNGPCGYVFQWKFPWLFIPTILNILNFPKKLTKVINLLQK